mmetsp:Transcript_63910/g.183678  ORF Transcript_63910/g.183678 Transcript_63910/m.183678 type:complete len:376 (+) Transcript_63910:53-1180(+)
MRAKGKKADSGPMDGTVVIGTYDGGLIGLRAGSGEQAFGYAPHLGCVKSVACSGGGRCASGGTDHMVRLFDLAKGKELGELQEHDDTVGCVEFWGATNLVTGGVDGLACIWRCSDFELLLKFRAHKSAMTCMAVHSSGKLMASAARDNSIRLWDLMRGTSAASVPVDEAAESMLWSPSGNRLAALSAGIVTVVDVALGGAAAVWRNPTGSGLMRVALISVIFVREDELLVGDGKGEVRVLAFKPKDGGPDLVETCRLPADANRVRIKSIVGKHDDKGNLVFAIGTSSGRVEIWRFSAPGAGPATVECFQRMHEVETGVRLTCMAFWSGVSAQAAQEMSPLDEAMQELEDDEAAQDMVEADRSLKTRKKAKRKRRG